MADATPGFNTLAIHTLAIHAGAAPDPTGARSRKPGLGLAAILDHKVIGDQTNRGDDRCRHDDQVIEIADDGDKIRNLTDEAQGIIRLKSAIRDPIRLHGEPILSGQLRP